MASVFKRGGKGKWYATWFDHTGKRQTKSTRTTDHAAAKRIAAKLEADAALRRDGVIDAAMEAIAVQSQRRIEDHLTDYEAKLKAADRDAQYVRSTVKYIRDIAAAQNWTVAAAIHADGVNRFANNLRDEGKSARTIQAYLTAIKGFTNWLSEHHKLPRNPLASVRKPNPKADRRRERRMLLPDEWRWLRSTTAERYGMTSRERMLLYVTAIQTGHLSPARHRPRKTRRMPGSISKRTLPQTCEH